MKPLSAICSTVGSAVKTYFHYLSKVATPDYCPICGRGLVDSEVLLCLKCYYEIPRTDYHLTSDNPLALRLASLHAPVDRAVSYFFYTKTSPYSQLVRDAKYDGIFSIATDLGALYARELRQHGFFDDIDMIMPVPIHWRKYLRRGYNQSEKIAEGISSVAGVPVAGNLKAVKGHATQTRKSNRQRRNLPRGIFAVENPHELAGKHILLVDDVITTGATILECAKVVYAATRRPVSILSLATPSSS